MTVGIVGLGLIGASFAKAYKEAGWTVLIHDIDNSAVLMGKIAGFVDDTLTSEKLKDCDLVLICVYPQATIDYVKENAKNFRKGGLVMDSGGIKRVVCDECFKIAKKNGFVFVGAHPMAGNKYSGLKHSRASLFKGAPLVIVPETFDDMKILDRVKEAMAPAEFGSFCLSHADKHDEMIAFTSQLAHVVSNAYVKSPTAAEHHGFSAGSYKDLTRVAWLNATMWSELFMENKDNLVKEIDSLITELSKYKDAMISNNKDELKQLLEDGSQRKAELDG
ncbi:MAG: prephenate dehydrogenase [Spirochaetaceae bacterium]|nr:prephenate dehydrogenase [Spirochaetaceae bacterium]MBO4704889.1 prephenate dehydrogenase [Spirochaetaceae bacterium]